MKIKYFILSVFIPLLTPVSGQTSSGRTPAFQDLNRSEYDQKTLECNSLPVLMPYNRIIQPAGKVIKYGNPDVENHSLDMAKLSDAGMFAVEDRYGIAIFDKLHKKIIAQWSYLSDKENAGMMSTYSGIQAVQLQGQTHIFWSAADSYQAKSKVFEAVWNGKDIRILTTYDFAASGDSPLALPNELAVNKENGKYFLYVVLNGNNQLQKIDLLTRKTVWLSETGVAPYGIVLHKGLAFVTNWGGDKPGNDALHTAGVPYGKVAVDPVTGATNSGTVSVFNLADGRLLRSVGVGLHPNDIVKSHDGQWLFVSNSNTDDISVISTQTLDVVETISVQISPGADGFIGDSPNAMAVSANDSTLYVANGMDNAVAVVQLNIDKQQSRVKGYIPTEAYPGALAIDGKELLVCNLEGEGARVNSRDMTNAEALTRKIKSGAYNSHHQKATLSVISIPGDKKLEAYTSQVKKQMLAFRLDLAKMAPRRNQPARPMPERIGEPSVFKHVIYIIKENRTYDQILGDMPEGNGRAELCIFGDSVTPNQHRLARNFVLLDNYYASGKCSAEGHQWTDAAMVTDYVEKNVRAWFRSYPHVQNDALVYGRKGFIWNNAADHGKKVRIYGEACEPVLEAGATWQSIYNDFLKGEKLKFSNETTIEGVKPYLSTNYPGYDSHRIPDVLRAQTFIDELEEYEKMDGDEWPELMVMALPADHTGGTRSDLPTPRAMVADNDLALGRIVEAVSKSRFWKNTVIFVTEDDSQAGWDHVSAYRTTGFVISPYSRLKSTVSVNYNQTCMVRSIEQILGIPPMNLLDATARPMFECFGQTCVTDVYEPLPNLIPLNEMNGALTTLQGKALYYAQQSMRPEFSHIDSGDDDLLNRIVWFSVNAQKKYPAKFAGQDADDDDD